MEKWMAIISAAKELFACVKRWLDREKRMLHGTKCRSEVKLERAGGGVEVFEQIVSDSNQGLFNLELKIEQFGTQEEDIERKNSKAVHRWHRKDGEPKS